MTFEEYIRNPMGKENAVFSQRFMFKELYTAKFNALLAREAGKLGYVLFKDSDKRYIIHFSIPSEKVHNFYYDVIIEFSTKDQEIAASTSLKDYDVRFFSNDPSFVFTFAHAFKTSKMFMTDMTDKMSEQALKELGKDKNPKDLVGYVKSIYFAYLFYKMKGLDKKISWSGASKYTKLILLNAITHADKKIEDRQRLGTEENKKQSAIRKKERMLSHPVPKSAKSKSISITKHTGRSKITAHTTTVKRK